MNEGKEQTFATEHAAMGRAFRWLSPQIRHALIARQRQTGLDCDHHGHHVHPSVSNDAILRALPVARMREGLSVVFAGRPARRNGEHKDFGSNSAGTSASCKAASASSFAPCRWRSAALISCQ